MIYLDTAALVKLVRIEADSEALVAWLHSHPATPLVASALVEVELPRVLRRAEPAALGSVAAVLARLHRVEISAEVRATAGAYQDSHLRSLDAIHLATAQMLLAAGRTITAFVTYDHRLSAAAAVLGLPVAAPAAERG